jgi:hypothetical protein
MTQMQEKNVNVLRKNTAAIHDSQIQQKTVSFFAPRKKIPLLARSEVGLRSVRGKGAPND